MKKSGTEKMALLLMTICALVMSGISPYDRPTWFLEVFPVFIGIAIMVPTNQSFPLTPLLYRLLFLHALILILGGHYTYARVPLGFRVQDLFEMARNPYDRLGHFVQGFVPAILAREILIRKKVVSLKGWLFFIVVSICLAFSAFYELFEWWTAKIYGGPAEDFLATQGDVWDTQWDMFMALVGALSSQLIFSKLHNHQIDQLER